MNTMSPQSPAAPRPRLSEAVSKAVANGKMDSILMAMGVKCHLTPREAQALLYAINEADRQTRLDFGTTDNLTRDLAPIAGGEKAAGALITNLSKKGAIILWKPMRVNDGDVIQQSTFHEPTLDLLFSALYPTPVAVSR